MHHVSDAIHPSRIAFDVRAGGAHQLPHILSRLFEKSQEWQGEAASRHRRRAAQHLLPARRDRPKADRLARCQEELLRALLWRRGQLAHRQSGHRLRRRVRALPTAAVESERALRQMGGGVQHVGGPRPAAAKLREMDRVRQAQELPHPSALLLSDREGSGALSSTRQKAAHHVRHAARGV